jgi:hypothetical protein
LSLLLPVEQWEPRDLFTQGHLFPWCFRVKVPGHVLGGVPALSSFVCRKLYLPPSNGAWRCAATSGAGDQDCWAVSLSSPSSSG